MTFTAGTKLGTYEIIGPLGKGGMGEVYRARDAKLKREVAIKVLPDAFARDADRVARFQREAEVLASLNHPHIAAVYDFVDLADSRFLVLELVEGETLADRIARGPIPIKESLAIAKQIAEALEEAHEKGVIHRDLKPANIKITADGSAKVLDFGLAKARETAIAADVSNSPTMMSGSIPGMIMGTAGYMSPEQANGKEADRTSDVWAFGCVLYEMLTGQRTFDGSTVTEIFAGILKSDPDWRRLPSATPESVRRLLRRCLQKDRKVRLRDIGDALVELQDAGETTINADGIQTSRRRRERLIWALLVAGLAVVAAVGVFRPTPIAPEMRLDITTPPTPNPLWMAISPDGKNIVFASTSGISSLWIRSLDSTAARPLPGTDNGSWPFWAPDSRSVGFVADGKLKHVDIDGGSIQALTTVGNSQGGTWGSDGVILYTATPGNAILRIPSTGGQPAPVTHVDTPKERAHTRPQLLPDGHHFIYYVVGQPEVNGVYVSNIDGTENHRLFDAESPAVFSAAGYLLFIRQGTLFAQKFDLKRFSVSENPFAVAEQVVVASTSASGPIAYRAGSGVQRRFAWVDRAGREVQNIEHLDNAAPLNPSLSPDGRRVAMQRGVSGNADIWLLELERSVLTRFTFDPATENYPVWSPDGGRIVFSSSRKSVNDLYQKSATGAGNEELLLDTPQGVNKMATDWSRDGRFLLFGTLAGNADIWALPMDGDRKPFPVVQTNFNERLAQFSPDGKWITYESNESGRFEVYAQAFPTSGGKWQISTNGGAMAAWGSDGKELFYVGLDGRLMSASITFASDGRSIQAGTPVPLFMSRIGGAVQGTARRQYMVYSDGQRFLMNTIAEETTSPITVILNWRPKS